MWAGSVPALPPLQCGTRIKGGGDRVKPRCQNLAKFLLKEVQELVGFQMSQVIILICESSFVSLWDVEGEVKYK